MNRREFIKGGALAGAGLALGLSGCGEEGVEFTEPSPTLVRTTGDLEEAAQWLTDVPRDALFAGIAARVAGGMDVGRLYDAAFLSTLRSFPQQSLNHAGLWYGAARALAGSDKKLALGMLMHIRSLLYAELQWIRDNITFERLGEPQPRPGDDSEQRFAQALASRDHAGAERAAVAMLRTRDQNTLRELMWSYGTRDFDGVGHDLIALAQYLDAADAMGWEHAEAPIRGLVRRLINRGDDPGQADDFPLNALKAAAQASSPQWLEAPRTDRDALDLLAELRGLDSQQASDAIVDRLGAVSPEAMWDGLALHSVEALLAGGPQHDGFNVHKLTGLNAMRTGFRSVESIDLKLQLLLQAASYTRWFPALPAGAVPVHVDDAEPAIIDGSARVEDVFEVLGSGFMSSELYGASTAHDPARQREARSLLLALLDADPDNARAYRVASADMLYRKANNAHHYKCLYALFDEVDRVGPTLKNPLLAASAFYTNGATSADLPGLSESRAALAGLPEDV